MGEILSMTGYGSAKGVVAGQELTVELKSVNNRYLDCSVRLPRSLLFAEEAVKQAVSASVNRGKWMFLFPALPQLRLTRWFVSTANWPAAISRLCPPLQRTLVWTAA